MPLQLDDLAALDAPTLDNTGQPLMLSVGSIDEDPEQPRREFEDNRLEDLAETSSLPGCASAHLGEAEPARAGALDAELWCASIACVEDGRHGRDPGLH